MVDITQLGIVLENLSDNFQKFEFDILSGYPMKFGKNIQAEYGLLTFQEFVETEAYKKFVLYKFENILQVKPFYEALKRKGFECYVDKDNCKDQDTCQLVVALNI